MAFPTTVISLATISVLFFGGDTIREKIMKSKKNFILLSSFSLAPFLGVFIQQHRGFLYSIIFVPVILLALAALFRKIEWTKEREMDLVALIGCIMWLIHIFLSIGVQPTAYLWPISMDYYAVLLRMTVSVEGFWILPFYVTEISLDITRYTQEMGSATHIENLGISDRVALLMERGFTFVDEFRISFEPVLTQYLVEVFVFITYCGLFYFAGREDIFLQLRTRKKESKVDQNVIHDVN